MAYGFLDIAATPAVKAAQEANGSRRLFENFEGDRAFDRFGPDEAAYIADRDSFYIASVSETGWPYMQHRGGPPGFLRVLDEKTLGVADFMGNRQYISLGNISANDRVCLFLMDYPRRARMKIYARAEARDLAADPQLALALTLEGYRARVERGLIFHLEAFDWNCAQHITPRFTQGQIDAALAPVRAHIAALEAENQALRARLGEPTQPVDGDPQ
jgi:predicted pyridoxine 5'-phosphate oxidase superfamily flavin-nucleotide-binding protein